MRILKSLREYKIKTIIVPFLVLISSIIEVILPFLISDLIDVGIYKSDLNYILKRGMIVLGLTIISFAISIVVTVLSSIVSAGLAKNIRKDIFYNIQSFSFSNINKIPPSSLMTRLTTDIRYIQSSFSASIVTLVKMIFIIIFALIMTFYINFTVGIIYLISVPIFSLILVGVSLYTYPFYAKAYKEFDNMNNVVEENINAIRLVKSYGIEDNEIKKFNNVIYKIFSLFYKADSISQLVYPIFLFFIDFTIILIVLICGKSIVFGNMMVGQLMGIIIYATQIFLALVLIAQVMIMFAISVNSKNRIIEVLDTKSEIVEKQDGVKEVKDGSIEFENVSFSYNGSSEYALNNINFRIESGETVGIIGSTGSGKSTLIELIDRFYDVTSGSIKLGGVDVRNYNLESLRNNIALVLQKNTLFTGTIKENIKWGNESATDEEIINACKIAQADKFIQEFSDAYETNITHNGNNLSGGQKQRLCIARALVKDAKIMIFDDVSSALDITTESNIYKRLKEEFYNKTKIIIAQKISAIKDADKIIVMDKGKIVGIGDFDKLMGDEVEIFKYIYESQKFEESIVDERL